MKLLKYSFIATLINIMALIQFSYAGDVPTLKSKVVTSNEVVTIGDFFYNAGRHASTPIFRSPNPGTIGEIQTTAILAQARRNGMMQMDDMGLKVVTVMRADNLISKTDIEDTIRDAFIDRYKLGEMGELNLSYDTPIQDIRTNTTSPSIDVDNFAYSSQSGRFVISLNYKNGNNDNFKTFTIKGTAFQVVEIPVLSSNIRRGDIVDVNDVHLEKITMNVASNGPPLRLDDVIGKESRRSLRAGNPIRTNDIKEPTLVSRNDLVSIIYEQGSLRLSAQGRALENGARGEVVSVLNAQSKQVVRAKVNNYGQVNVKTASF